MRVYRMVLAAAAVALAAGALGGTAHAQGLISSLFGGSSSASNISFWQGSWGIEGKTPVVTVAGSAVSYEGADKQMFAVSNIVIGDSQVTFEVGSADVALTKHDDASLQMVSTIGDNSSAPILLCKATAAHCP
jgi:hypothetical protein